MKSSLLSPYTLPLLLSVSTPLVDELEPVEAALDAASEVAEALALVVALVVDG
jgi:hypothetical protein